MRTATIQINEKNYLLCFSARVIKACTERYGSVEKIFDALQTEDAMQAMEESFWLLAEMLDAGARYAKVEGMENPKPLTKEELYDVFDISSMAYIQLSIATTVTNGATREVVATPDPKEKKPAGRKKKTQTVHNGASGMASTLD